MNRIIWTGDRFECSSSELEEEKWEVIRDESKSLHAFMLRLDFLFYDYAIDDGDIIVIHSYGGGKLDSFPIADEGAGFNVCFHLGAYAIASMNLGQKLEICAYSFKSLLHPVLFQGLSKWFSDQPAQEVDKNCSYYSGDSTLKCAVNPSLPCKDCSDVSAGFNENLFVWKGTELGDRLRRVIPEQPFTEGVVGVDRGSGQDATAIATGFTNADGSIRVETLEIHANATEEDIEMARLRAYDRNFREVY